MEESTARNVVFHARLKVADYEQLSALRSWTNLEMGREGDTLWLKNLSHDQINAPALRRIPLVERYYEKQGKLFFYNQLLPQRKVPDIDWQPIARQTALVLPDYNFNYFGSEEKITLRVVPSNQEKPTAALQTTLPVLTEYLTTAPAIRYQHLQWVLINYEDVFLVGTPLIPIPGKSFWRNGVSFIPAGYDFEIPALTPVLTKKIIGSKNSLIIWNEKSEYYFINKEDLNYLNLAAVRN